MKNGLTKSFLFFQNDKNLGRSDDAKRRKKEDDLKAKKNISHLLSWRQTWASGVTWVYKVASFILEIIPLQVSCKAMIGDYKLHRSCVFSHAAIRLIERKERFYVRKRFNSHRIGLEHQNGYLFLKQLLFRNPKVAEMTSCENALLSIFSMRRRLDRCSVELHYGNQL